MAAREEGGGFVGADYQGEADEEENLSALVNRWGGGEGETDVAHCKHGAVKKHHDAAEEKEAAWKWSVGLRERFVFVKRRAYLPPEQKATPISVLLSVCFTPTFDTASLNVLWVSVSHMVGILN